MHIRNTLKAVVFCVQTCAAFIPGANDGHDLESVLSNISGVPALSLFQNVSVSPVMKHLPNIIREFCPSVIMKTDVIDLYNIAKQEDTLDREFLKMECTNWLDRVHDLICHGTSKVLAHVNTISALSTIRRNTYDFLVSTSSQVW